MTDKPKPMTRDARMEALLASPRFHQPLVDGARLVSETISFTLVSQRPQPAPRNFRLRRFGMLFG